jgi:hypothetical protein
MSSIQLFGDLLKSVSEKFDDKYRNETTNGHFKYIGTGNPEAKILIIGKEVACEVGTPQFIMEIENNYSCWENYVSNCLVVVDTWNRKNYHPRYPYKGQLNKRDHKGNNGTSVTWMNYQKLFDKYFGMVRSSTINFHDNVFLTEVNSSPSKKTKEADTSSITFRKEHVLSHVFFKKFPVVIISGLGYFDITKESNEIESLFDVKYKGIKEVDGKGQRYWIHKSEDGLRLVINVRQLSMNISDSLLQHIADDIKAHLKFS